MREHRASLSRLLQPVTIEIKGRHVHALGGKRLQNTAANPLGGTGDDGPARHRC